MGVALGLALAAKPYKPLCLELGPNSGLGMNLTTTWGGSSLMFDPTQDSLGTILFRTLPKFRAEV